MEQTRGRTHEGTGIGLALVMELVKLHHGTVTVESELGRGSTFVVSLRFGAAHLPQDRIGVPDDRNSPSQQANAYVEEALRWLQEPSRQSDLPAKPKNPRGLVLLADDNRDMRDYMSRLLGKEYEVVTAPNGQEALSLARSNPPDLILSDVMMPVLDGFGLLRALRENQDTREVPVILSSARAGDEAKEEGLTSGADDYLVKPFSARELLARVPKLGCGGSDKSPEDALRNVAPGQRPCGTSFSRVCARTPAVGPGCVCVRFQDGKSIRAY